MAILGGYFGFNEGDLPFYACLGAIGILFFHLLDWGNQWFFTTNIKNLSQNIQKF